MATATRSTAAKKPAAKTTDIDELIKLGKKNYSEGIESKNKSSFDYNDGTYPMLWNGFTIQQAQDDSWGVLNTFLFLDEPYKDKLYYNWLGMMSRREGEEHLFNGFLLEFLEKVTGTKAEDLEFANRDELEAILKDAFKQDQVWNAKFSTRKYIAKSGANAGNEVEAQNFRLLKHLEDYVLIKGGKKTAAAAKAGTKAAKKSECPFEVDEEVEITQGSGTVVSIDEDNETVDVKVGKKIYKGIEWGDVNPEDVNPEDEEEYDEENEFAENDVVSFTVTEGTGKKKTETTLTGTITSIDSETATVSVDTGEVDKKKTPIMEDYEVELDELTKAEEDEEDEEDTENDEEGVTDANGKPIEVGDSVAWSVTTGKGTKKSTEDFEGEVLEIDDEGTLTIKVGGTAKKPVTEEVDASEVEVQGDEEEEDEDDEEASGYSEGDEVSFTIPADKKTKREEFSGTGKVVEVDDEGMLTVKVGKKSYEVDPEWVDSEDDEEDEEEDGDDVLEPGKVVEYKDAKSKKTLQGTVISVDDNAGTCKVKTGSMTKVINQDQIAAILAGDDDEE